MARRGCRLRTKMEGRLIRTDTIEQIDETIKEIDRQIELNNKALAC